MKSMTCLLICSRFIGYAVELLFSQIHINGILTFPPYPFPLTFPWTFPPQTYPPDISPSLFPLYHHHHAPIYIKRSTVNVYKIASG